MTFAGFAVDVDAAALFFMLWIFTSTFCVMNLIVGVVVTVVVEHARWRQCGSFGRIRV